MSSRPGLMDWSRILSLPIRPRVFEGFCYGGAKQLHVGGIGDVQAKNPHKVVEHVYTIGCDGLLLSLTLFVDEALEIRDGNRMPEMVDGLKAPA